jgi:hypothetical protein
MMNSQWGWARERARGVLLAALLVAGAGGGADDDGKAFTSLFDGKSLDGWVSVATDRFTARQGVLAYDGGTGWLRSVKVYKDFEFRAEYRILRPGSDSGVFFHASAASNPKGPYWPSKGYQLQVIDAENNFMFFGHGTPLKSDRKTEGLKKVMKGPGEWQSIRLKVVGNRAEAWLNGTLITVSDSISLPEGHIGLQGEHGQIEWRALEIKELPTG